MVTETRDPRVLRQRPPSGTKPSQENLKKNFIGNQNIGASPALKQNNIASNL